MFISIFNIINELVLTIIYFSGLPYLVREVIQRNKVTIILYHDIDEVRFEKHVDALKKRYNIIGLEDFLRSKKDLNFKLPKKSLIITFDDGHKNNYKLSGVLKKYKVPVTIFLCSSIIDSNKHFWFKCSLNNSDHKNLRKISDKKRIDFLKNLGFDEKKEFDTRQALNKDEILEMKPYVNFQSHTKYHPFLITCDNIRSEEEIVDSKKELEQKYGLEIDSLSYPNGDYSDREIEFTKKSGYKLAITVDLGFNSLSTDPYRLKRICISDNATVFVMLAQVSGVWRFIRNIFIKPNCGYSKEIVN